MTTDRRGGLLDYAAIRAQISIADVLALLNYQPRRAQVAKCRGPCPLHENDRPPDSKSTCFSVHLQRNVFKCFECGAEGNQLDLWHLHIGLPFFQATLELCRRARITPPRLPASATPKPVTHKPRPAKKHTTTHRQTGPIPDRH
jgi:DNA primase